MAGAMPPTIPGQNVVPFPPGGASPMMGAPGMGMPPQQPPMMPNPAYQQWMQMAQAWQQETQQKQQQFLDACDYVKTDAHKRYNIDIEADSTIAPDQEAEKAARTQFLQAITPFMESVLPLAQSNPAAAPLVKELIMFAVNGFSVSRQLQDAFETALDHMMQQAQQGPPQASQKGNSKSPQEIQAEAQIAQGEQQTDLAVQQQRTQADQQKYAAQTQIDQQKNAVEMMKLYSQQQIEREKLAADGQYKAADLALKQRQGALREGLANARMSHYAASDTEGLV